jgi:Leucine-rich repeat (LRR) protein
MFNTTYDNKTQKPVIAHAERIVKQRVLDMQTAQEKLGAGQGITLLLNNLRMHTSELRDVIRYAKEHLNFAQINGLEFSGNCLDELPEEIYDLFPDIKYLWLENNRLTELEGIQRFSKLQRVSIKGNMLPFLRDCLGRLPELQYLDASNQGSAYKFEKLPDSIAANQTVRHLDLSCNELKNLGNLRMPALQELNLRANLDLGERVFESIGNLRNLNSLKLGLTQISKLPGNMPALPELIELDLSDNVISAVHVDLKVLYPKLRTLNIGCGDPAVFEGAVGEEVTMKCP